MSVRRVLAADAVAAAGLPEKAIALRDGWVVHSDLVADAGPYAPTPLMPSPRWVEIGDAVGGLSDAVLAPDAVTIRDGMAEALTSAAPGEGVLPAQSDAAAGQTLRRAGERLRAIDLAVLHATRIARVQVRAPAIRIMSLSASASDDAVGPLIAHAIVGDGATAQMHQLGGGDEAALAAALAEDDVDAVIGIGGTGMGRRDFAVRVLSQVGTVAAHGVGIMPGETAAIGSVGARPVLLLPGRLDAALAVYLALGRPMLSRLTGLSADDRGRRVTLTRKIISTVGMAEVALVRHHEDGVEPVATGTFPLHAIARADGYLLVPPESEGYPAGAVVEMRALP
jgi:molybdopterin biosynthesis enzyme